MLELITTRHNPMVDPALHVWGWEIPVYLFLGGWVAGCMVLAGWLMWRGRAPGERSVAYVLPWIGIVLLQPRHGRTVPRPRAQALRVADVPDAAADLADVVGRLDPDPRVSVPGARRVRIHPGRTWLSRWPSLAAFSQRLREPSRLRWLGAASIAVGIALGIYTGILLSSLGARPLWASAVLGPLFLVSGLSTGAAFAHMIAGDRAEQSMLLHADIVFLMVELALIALFLIGHLTSGAQHANAARLLLGGPYTAVFWVLVVGPRHRGAARDPVTDGRRTASSTRSSRRCW